MLLLEVLKVHQEFTVELDVGDVKIPLQEIWASGW